MTETETESDTLLWDFFEKKSASSRVLQATLAYGWRVKLVCLNMDMFRRHRNTSRQVMIARRVEIMNEFVCKLRRSGYGTKTVAGIIEQGSKFYYRKLRADLEGGPPLNRREESNLVMDRRQKMGVAETWYVRRRGGAKQKLQKEQGWRSSQVLGGLGGHTKHSGGRKPPREEKDRFSW